MNDCARGFVETFHKRVSSLYLSNYPIVSAYVEGMGVPTNPAYVPMVIGSEIWPMHLGRRALNSLVHLIAFIIGKVSYAITSYTFKSASNIDLPHVTAIEEKTLFFTTPLEMLIDTPRPLMNSMRYFGCEGCTDLSETKGNITEILSISDARSGFIIVSFGSVTKGDFIPIEQLRRFLRTFAKFEQHTIIWQLDIKPNYLEQALRAALNTTFLPSHIHIFSWIPLKTLVRDPRVKLMISHGGLQTCIEAINGGVPILSLALQGDQSYNAQRFVEKKVGEFIQGSKFTEEELTEKMLKMTLEHSRYKEATLKLRSMLRDYKSLQKSPSVFWLSWATRHFSSNDKNKSKRAQRFMRSAPLSANWLLYYNVDALLSVGGGLFAIIYCLC